MPIDLENAKDQFEKSGESDIKIRSSDREGVYQCFAENQWGTTADEMIEVRAVKLKLKAKSATSDTKVAIEGHSAFLECGTTESVPKHPKYFWKIVDSSDDKYIHYLDEKDARQQINQETGSPFNFVVRWLSSVLLNFNSFSLRRKRCGLVCIELASRI